jgi:hypothetical protein
MEDDIRGETGYQKPYLVKHKSTLTEQIEWRENSLKSSPVINPRRTPEEILGDNYSVIKEALSGFGKSKQEWDEYVRKIDFTTRAAMTRCFAECRENGFYGPRIGADGEIKFAQMVNPIKYGNEVYRVEVTQVNGDVDIKVVAKEFLRPNMTVIERIK